MVRHSSELRGLRSTKCSSETLQNLLYFMYQKTHVVFSFSFRATLYFYLMNALVYVEYTKFWSVSLEHFVERKPLISEEWSGNTWMWGGEGRRFFFYRPQHMCLSYKIKYDICSSWRLVWWSLVILYLESCWYEKYYC